MGPPDKCKSEGPISDVSCSAAGISKSRRRLHCERWLRARPVAMKKRAAYCASKGGLTLLTKAIAIDHGHENIRANCICPSIVETDLVSELFKTPDGERAKLERLATIPLARFGKPNDIAGLAVFLASDESSWLTGAAIPVDGGLTAA